MSEFKPMICPKTNLPAKCGKYSCDEDCHLWTQADIKREIERWQRDQLIYGRKF
jgi:hypothetical protein